MRRLLLALCAGHGHAPMRQRAHLSVDSEGEVGLIEAGGGLGLSRAVPEPLAEPAARHQRSSVLEVPVEPRRTADNTPLFPLTAFALLVFAASAGWAGQVALAPAPTARGREQGLRDRYAVYVVSLADLFLMLCACMAPIAESYALMQDVGKGAVASGWILGGPFALKGLTGLFVLCFKWHQPLARALMVSGVLGRGLSCLLYALFAWPPHWFPWQSPDARYAGLLAARLLLGVMSFTSFLSKTMSAKVAPAQDKVAVGVLIMCAVTLGIGGGPLLSSLCNLVLVPGSASGRSALPQVVLAGLHGALGLGALLLPSDLGPALRLAGEQPAQEHAQGPLRQALWRKALFYGLERALVVAACEAATAFVLVTEFQWTTEAAGMAVSATFCLGLPFASVLMCRRDGRTWAQDLQTARTCAWGSLGASALFFTPIGGLVTHKGGVVLVLLADALIFPSGYLASGILDGLAFECSDPTGLYTIEAYCVLSNLVQDSLGRFLAPPLTRYILSYYGRDAYALAQLLLTGVGLYSLTLTQALKQEWDSDDDMKHSAADEPEREPDWDETTFDDDDAQTWATLD